jgi:hypothetical protein
MIATFKFIVSLPHFPSDWRANHVLQLTAAGRRRRNRRAAWPPSLGLVTSRLRASIFMKPLIRKNFFAVFLCSLLCASNCFARLGPLWPYEKLVAESDAVAIIEPIKNEPAQDTFPGYGYGHPTNHFTATDTRFKIHAVLKGEAMKELTILHFSYSTNVSMIANGVSFIQFTIGSLEYEVTLRKDGKPVGDKTIYGPRPVMWMAFLKRRKDGRFEPVTGHYDASYSFRELHSASIYAKP